MPDSADYAVLEVLARAQCEYVPLDVVADAANLTVAQTTEPIERLAQLGVPVESHPVYGIRLTLSFDLIDRRIVSERLKARGIDWQVHGRLEAGSTNDLANSPGGGVDLGGSGSHLLGQDSGFRF